MIPNSQIRRAIMYALEQGLKVEAIPHIGWRVWDKGEAVLIITPEDVALGVECMIDDWLQERQGCP